MNDNEVEVFSKHLFANFKYNHNIVCSAKCFILFYDGLHISINAYIELIYCQVYSMCRCRELSIVYHIFVQCRIILLSDGVNEKQKALLLKNDAFDARSRCK